VQVAAVENGCGYGDEDGVTMPRPLGAHPHHKKGKGPVKSQPLFGKLSKGQSECGIPGERALISLLEICQPNR